MAFASRTGGSPTAQRSRWIIAIPLAVLAIATVYPLLFAANVALKDRKAYILDRFGLTDVLAWSNFSDAWSQSSLGRYLVNSVIVTLGSVVVLLLVGSMAGYALGQLTFPGRRWVYLSCLAALMIPFQVIMVPFARLMSDLSLLNSYFGLIIAYVSLFLPFTIYLMASFYSGISRSISEAAVMDGASLWEVYRHIMIPLGRPALLSVAILNAVFCWNDVLVSLIVMQEEQKRTLMIGVSALRGQYSANIPVYAAGIMIAALPMLAIYLIFQRQIATGVTAGATKG